MWKHLKVINPSVQHLQIATVYQTKIFLVYLISCFLYLASFPFTSNIMMLTLLNNQRLGSLLFFGQQLYSFFTPSNSLAVCWVFQDNKGMTRNKEQNHWRRKDMIDRENKLCVCIYIVNTKFKSRSCYLYMWDTLTRGNFENQKDY